MRFSAHNVINCSRNLHAAGTCHFRKKSITFRAVLCSFLFLVLSLVSAVLFPSTVAAQGTYSSTPSYHSPTENVNPDVVYNQHTRSQVLLIETMNAIACQIAGIDIIDPEKGCLGIDPQTRKIGYVKPHDAEGRMVLGGAMGSMTNMVAQLYNPPASSTNYIAHLQGNFGLVKDANAQVSSGEGFSRFTNLLDLFVFTRNFAYLVLLIFFVVIGMAIMLRVHIDPRTVMTVQNQIPKIIIAIITITFSYAIVGLLIDTMWVTTYFAINAVTKDRDCDNQGGKTLNEAVTNSLLDNPIGFVTNILGDETGCLGKFDGITGLSKNVATTFGDAISRTVLATIFQADERLDSNCSAWKPWTYGDCGKEAGFSVIKFLVSFAAFFIILIALLIALMKTWFMLIKAYIKVIINVILAPLWIVMGLMPGSSLGFGSWFKNTLAHLSVFPATALMLIMARVLATNIPASNPQDSVFIPPLLGNPNIPDNVNWLLAAGFIFMTPDMVTVLRDALKQPPSKIGGNITKRVMSGAGGGALQSAGGLGLTLSGLRGLPIVSNMFGKGDLPHAETPIPHMAGGGDSGHKEG